MPLSKFRRERLILEAFIASKIACIGEGDELEVDGIENDAVFQVLADLTGNLDPNSILGLMGRSGDMWRDNHVVQSKEGRVPGRLLYKDVERSACDVAISDCRGERCIINQLAASAVDDAHTAFHLGQRLLINQAGCLRGQR